MIQTLNLAKKDTGDILSISLHRTKAHSMMIHEVTTQIILMSLLSTRVLTNQTDHSISPLTRANTAHIILRAAHSKAAGAVPARCQHTASCKTFCLKHNLIPRVPQVPRVIVIMTLNQTMMIYIISLRTGRRSTGMTTTLSRARSMRKSTCETSLLRCRMYLRTRIITSERCMR